MKDSQLLEENLGKPQWVLVGTLGQYFPVQFSMWLWEVIPSLKTWPLHWKNKSICWHDIQLPPPREDSNNEDQILWSRKDVDWSAASSAQNGRGYPSISPRCYGDISNFSTGLSFCSSLGAKLDKFTLTSGVVWGSVLCKFFLGGWLVTS